MKLTASFFTVLAVLCTVCVTVSCSKMRNLAGTWQGTPARITVAGADDATSTMSVSFAPLQKSGKQGDVVLNATVELRQAVRSAEAEIDSPWEVTVAATASMAGRYVTEDEDDIVMFLDPSTLQVIVDPDGVAYTQNIITGMEQPRLDSLTSATAEAWRVRLTSVMRDEFLRYSKMEDVEIHHNDLMSAELGRTDISLRRVE